MTGKAVDLRYLSKAAFMESFLLRAGRVIPFDAIMPFALSTAPDSPESYKTVRIVSLLE